MWRFFHAGYRNLRRFFNAGSLKFVRSPLTNFVETFSRTILHWSAPEAKESSGRGEPERGKQTFGASNEIPSAIFQSVQNGCESSRPPEDGGKVLGGAPVGWGSLSSWVPPLGAKRTNSPTQQNYKDKNKAIFQPNPHFPQKRTLIIFQGSRRGSNY